MTYPTWPFAELSCFTRDGFSAAFPDGRITTKMERGAPKVRRGSRATRPLARQFPATRNELARFEMFCDEELLGCVLPFWVKDWRFNGAIMATETGEPITTETGEVITLESWSLVQFADSTPQYSPLGTKYMISISLIELPY